MTDTEYLKPDERIDDLELSDLRIIQDPAGFCFGMDAVLLSGFVHAAEGERCLDIGCGGGIIPILMSAKTEAYHLTGIEIQEKCADMARRSVSLNHLEDRIDIINGDIREAARYFEAASFDVVTSNPPYMIADHGLVNADPARTISRHEVSLTLDELAQSVERVLRTGGRFFMVHRPFRLAEILCTLRDHHLEPKRMRLVYPYVDREPNMVLIESVRGGRSGMTVEKPLIVYDAPDVYSAEMVRDYGF